MNNQEQEREQCEINDKMDSSKLLKNVYGIDIHFEDLVYQVKAPRQKGA